MYVYILKKYNTEKYMYHSQVYSLMYFQTLAYPITNTEIKKRKKKKALALLKSALKYFPVAPIPIRVDF